MGAFLLLTKKSGAANFAAPQGNYNDRRRR